MTYPDVVTCRFAASLPTAPISTAAARLEQGAPVVVGRSCPLPTNPAACNSPATTRSVTKWRSTSLEGRPVGFATPEMALRGTRKHSLTSRRMPSHGGNTGSNPVCATSYFQGFLPQRPPLDPRSAAILQPKCSVADGTHCDWLAFGGTDAAGVGVATFGGGIPHPSMVSTFERAAHKATHTVPHTNGKMRCSQRVPGNLPLRGVQTRRDRTGTQPRCGAWSTSDHGSMWPARVG